MSFQFALSDFISFRDRKACEAARNIPRSKITEHANPDFNIRIIDSKDEFYFQFALDIVRRLKHSDEANERLVGIFPVGPMPQYDYAVELINRFQISCRNLHCFNMDEYADQDGNTAPETWAGSFKKSMMENFFGRIDEHLRPPAGQIYFPTRENITSYGTMIEDLGGADVCYGGIGWGGHIAFWEPQLGDEFGDDLAAYTKAGPRLVELHPMTIMQNALHSFSGDWSYVPPKAYTIGPAQIVGAKERMFWLDGYLGGGVSWQRFIARLVAHGPVSTYVPGSILQTCGPTTYTLMGGVADDVVVDMG